MKEDKNKKEKIKEKDKVKEKDKKETKKEETISLTKEEALKMNEKLKEAENEAIRAKADLINYRKRKDEETSKILKYCNEDLILEILPILDNFERAIKMDDDNLEDEVSKFLEGMKMVYASLTSALEKYGVSEIEALNKPFDPKYHQAVMTEEVKDKENEIVLEVYQKGYMLKDKVIRPAMVKVNK